MLGETIVPHALLPFMSHLEGEDRAVEQTKHTPLKIERMPRLSATESSIMHALIEGHSNKVIARRMNIAEATAKVHIKAILRKLGVHNRTQAAIWAMNNRPFLAGAQSKKPAIVPVPDYSDETLKA